MRTRWWLLLLLATAFLSVAGTLVLAFGHLVIEVHSSSNTDRAIEEAEQRRVAVHEAGHALVAAYLNGEDEIVRINVRTRVHDGQYGSMEDRDHNRLDTADDLMRNAAVFLGGRAADKFVNGAPTNGATSDLAHVTDIIWTMHLSNGLGNSLMVRSRGEAPAAVVAQVEADINASNACAEAIVRTNSDTVVLLADRIMRETESGGVRTLGGDAFRAFLADHPLRPLPDTTAATLMSGCHPPPH